METKYSDKEILGLIERGVLSGEWKKLQPQLQALERFAVQGIADDTGTPDDILKQAVLLLAKMDALVKTEPLDMRFDTFEPAELLIASGKYPKGTIVRVAESDGAQATIVARVGSVLGSRTTVPLGRLRKIPLIAIRH